MNWLKSRDYLKITLSVAWLVFTVAFALWWFRLGLDHVSRLAELQPDNLSFWERQRRMVFWEGTSWLVLLIIGGAALIGLVQKEKLRVRKIREFFASFSHEVKTSLASLRIQAEALNDELGRQSSPILTRLIGDTVRLQLQLENSLFFASQDGLQLFLQPLDLSPLVERMREQWPNLNIEFHGECTVRADERGMRTILSNLVQNAHVHGKAKTIKIRATANGNNRVIIEVSDDGRGFHGDVGALGELFHRPETTSGSGLGLYICCLLAGKMGGEMQFASSAGGFLAAVELEGSCA